MDKVGEVKTPDLISELTSPAPQGTHSRVNGSELTLTIGQRFRFAQIDGDLEGRVKEIVVSGDKCEPEGLNG